MRVATLVDWLEDRLGLEAYTRVDPSLNGLQVGRSDAEVDHVVGAVDAAIEPIDRAVDRDADALLVHHGLFWGEQRPLTGHRYDRIERLLDAEMALIAVHLPLDGHPEVGNAAQLGDRLGVTGTEAFAHLGGVPVGRRGDLPEPIDVGAFTEALAAAIDVDVDDLRPLGPRPESVRSVAVVTGSGTDHIDDAAAADVDVLVTGEPKQAAYHTAQDAGQYVVCGGHYATETAGVRAVLAELEAEGVETGFVDIPTGI